MPSMLNEIGRPIMRSDRPALTVEQYIAEHFRFVSWTREER
jgi:hypothetical protein